VKISAFSSVVGSSFFSSASPSLPSSSSSLVFLSSSSGAPNGFAEMPPSGFVNLGADEITSPDFEARAAKPEGPYPLLNPIPNPEGLALLPQFNPPAPKGLADPDDCAFIEPNGDGENELVDANGDADANGDVVDEDAAPNFEFLNRSEALVPGPKSGLAPEPAVAKGDFAEVFANPLFVGSCYSQSASCREFVPENFI
jgi:hypothetical protein